MKETRVIVCGGRDFENKQVCFEYLGKIVPGRKNVTIISGHANGADKFGEEYAALHGLNCVVFKPDWKQYGRAAGPIRNKQMLEYAIEETPLIIAFWDGKSKGTKNMIDQSKKAGAEVIIVYY